MDLLGGMAESSARLAQHCLISTHCAAMTMSRSKLLPQTYLLQCTRHRLATRDGVLMDGIAAKQGDEVLSLHFTSDLTMMA